MSMQGVLQIPLISFYNVDFSWQNTLLINLPQLNAEYKVGCFLVVLVWF